MRSLKPKYLFLFLPAIYLLFTGVFFFHWRPFYTIGPDPIYIYLFNGMNVASGNWKIFYIDNPGIPVQYFCASIIFFKHLFNHNIPLYQDVLLHPEEYIYTLCASVALIYFYVTWGTGKYVFRKTNNLALSLLFQLTPLISVHGILSTGGPSPESFYVISGMFFMAYLYGNTFSPELSTGNKITLRQIAIYGAFTAFFVSCKYICFPLLFLVLFILPNPRSRIQYIGSFILFLFVFMFPALSAWRNIKDWIFNLATHTGHYGQGDKGFINSSEFLPNIMNIFKQDIYFTTLYAVLIISLLVSLVRYRRADEKSKLYARLLGGIGVSSFLLILMVAKHYSFHYLLSIRLCYPLIIVGSYGVFKDSLKVKIFQNKTITHVLFYLFMIFITYSQVKTFMEYPPRQASRETADFLNKCPETPVIMVADFESSRIEPSLYLGAAYMGDFRNHYWEFLKKTYPYTYQYISSQNIVARWDDVFYTPELFSTYPKMMVYFIQKDSNTRTAILANLTLFGKDSIAQSHLVYSLKKTDEYIYELDGNRDMAKALMSKWTEVHFDLDKRTPDKSKFISVEGKDTATGTDLLSTEEHHSGTNSILMNWKNQYSLNYNIRAFPGNMVIARIWRKSNDGKGCIILSSKTDGDFYMSGQTAVDSDANGWKQIQYKCIVPPSIKDSTVFFYLYYYGHGHAYFDDLSVRVYPMKK